MVYGGGGHDGGSGIRGGREQSVDGICLKIEKLVLSFLLFSPLIRNQNLNE